MSFAKRFTMLIYILQRHNSNEYKTET